MKEIINFHKEKRNERATKKLYFKIVESREEAAHS